MAFSPQFLDELRARVSIADVAGRRAQLTRKGREHLGLCPFHKEKTPSFMVNEEKGFYHCFGCGEHGSAIDFVMKTERLSFPNAVEKLASQANMTIPIAQQVTPMCVLTENKDHPRSSEPLTLFKLDQDDLLSDGFVPSGVQNFKNTIEEFAKRLRRTSAELAKGDKAPGLPIEVNHKHVHLAAATMSGSPRQSQPGPWSIAGQVGEYVGTAIAAFGAGHIKTGTDINAWAIWAFGFGSILAIVLLLLRLSRSNRERLELEVW
jgi:hypothetical protein